MNCNIFVIIRKSDLDMSKVWKYILLIFAICLLMSAGFFSYNFYNEYKNPSLPGINAITSDSPLFLEIKKPLKTINKLINGNEFWQELIKIPVIEKIHNQIIFLDSVFSNNELINEIIENSKSFISINQVDSTNFESLFIVELPATNQTQTIESFIRKVNGDKSIVMQKEFENAGISMVNIPGFEQLFNYSVYKGLFLGSFEESVIRKTIMQLNTGSPINKDNNFIKLESTAGKNVDANIYFNYRNLGKLISTVVNSANNNFIKELSNLSQWTETDLIIKNDELLVNGYTITSDTDPQLLNNFRQEPQNIRIPEILPYNVTTMTHFGLESFEQFHESNNRYFEQTGKPNEYKSRINSLDKTYNINIWKDIFQWIGNEIAIASTASNGKTKDNTLFVIHSKDIKQAEPLLDKIAAKSSAKNGKDVFKLEFGDYVIKKIEIPTLFPDMFGTLFKDIENNYFVAVKDYFVFANNTASLINLINNFYSQKTLAENFNYQSFSNNISDKSNIYIYYNIRNSFKTISSYLPENISEIVINNENVIRNFEGFAIQFSYINKMFYTNIYFKYNPTYQEVNPSNWETEIDAKIVDKPYLIRNHKTGKLNIIVFDEISNMYLIDQTGMLKWKVPLIEPPISPVYYVDYYKNNKYQYLFNTENYLYLIDLNGNYVADYPIKLPTRTTNAISVFDYENNKEYRLMLALADNKVHNFSLDGNSVDGWNKVKAKTNVNYPVQHIVYNGKDYLFITDEEGNLIISNRKGEIRIKLKKNLRKAKNSNIHINRTNSKGIFITTNNKGKLVYISKSGKIKRTDFGDYSNEHYFFYDDFDNNNSHDFIFFDKNKLTVFNRMKEVIFEYEFPGEITKSPVFFKGKNNKNYFGVVVNETKEVYLFHNNQLISSDQKITGDTPITVGSLNNDDKLNLIIGSENKILNYLFQVN